VKTLPSPGHFGPKIEVRANGAFSGVQTLPSPIQFAEDAEGPRFLLVQEAGPRANTAFSGFQTLPSPIQFAGEDAGPRFFLVQPGAFSPVLQSSAGSLQPYVPGGDKRPFLRPAANQSIQTYVAGGDKRPFLRPAANPGIQTLPGRVQFAGQVYQAGGDKTPFLRADSDISVPRNEEQTSFFRPKTVINIF